MQHNQAYPLLTGEKHEFPANYVYHS